MNNYTFGDIVLYKGKRSDEKICGLIIFASADNTKNGFGTYEVLRFNNFLDCPSFDVSWIEAREILSYVSHVNLRDFYKETGFYNVILNMLRTRKDECQKMLDEINEQIEFVLKEKNEVDDSK